MRAPITTLLILFTCCIAQARMVSVVGPRLGLAFTETEVIDQTAATKAALLKSVREKDQFGCVVYCKMVRGVWQRLLPVIRFQQTGRRVVLRLVVVTSPDIQALSFPDGTVVISEAFIKREHLAAAQVAFVLAHEATHVLLQHERQTLTSMLALIPSPARRTPQDVYTEMEFNYFSMADSMAPVFHQVELEADEVGLQLAALAGYPPAAQLLFLQRSARREAGQSMVSTHPSMDNRWKQLRQLLPLAQRLFEVGRQ
jgi:predicted Zn-dependent protease